jgi:hypothetical protein
MKGKNEIMKEFINILPFLIISIFFVIIYLIIKKNKVNKETTYQDKYLFWGVYLGITLSIFLNFNIGLGMCFGILVGKIIGNYIKRNGKGKKIDKGFELYYNNLSNRRKFIRTIWVSMFGLFLLILFIIVKFDWLFILIYGIVLLIISLMQLIFTYKAWKMDDKK